MNKLVKFVITWFPRKFLQKAGPVFLKSLALFLRGSKYTCPIEERSYSTFLPYGRIKSRPNALCPGSLSLERHRLLWLYLKEKTNFFQQKLDVLHIAPEQCFIRKFEEQHGERYITGDLESPLAKVKLDVHKLPFNDNSFDVAMCNHVLEHVDDDIQALSEIKRVLRKGGWAILQVPFFYPIPEKTYEDPSITLPDEKEKHFGQRDHVRMYGKDYAERIRSVGLDVFEDKYVKTLSEKIQKKYVLPVDEIIYLCVKN